MWKCPVCQSDNRKGKICRECGFDDSRNYIKYLSVSPLSERSIKKFEQSFVGIEYFFTQGIEAWMKGIRWMEKAFQDEGDTEEAFSRLVDQYSLSEKQQADLWQYYRMVKAFSPEKRREVEKKQTIQGLLEEGEIYMRQAAEDIQEKASCIL